eukprot:scaffold7538_cov248-Pinguiococcus_pyrenoidosus.AAC.3
MPPSVRNGTQPKYLDDLQDILDAKVVPSRRPVLSGQRNTTFPPPREASVSGSCHLVEPQR